jgi:hypothetical protein
LTPSTMPSTGASPSSCSIGPSPRAVASRSPGSSTPGSPTWADSSLRPPWRRTRTANPYLERSYESLLGPARAAGKPLEILEFDGEAERGMAVLRKSLAANPEIDGLLVDDAFGVFVGFRIHLDWTKAGHRGFQVTGYTPSDDRIITFLDQIDAIGDRSVLSYAKMTSQAIRSLMDARPVGDVVGVPVTFIRTSKKPSPARTGEPPPQRTGRPRGGRP